VLIRLQRFKALQRFTITYILKSLSNGDFTIYSITQMQYCTGLNIAHQGARQLFGLQDSIVAVSLSKLANEIAAIPLIKKIFYHKQNFSCSMSVALQLSGIV